MVREKEKEDTVVVWGRRRWTEMEGWGDRGVVWRKKMKEWKNKIN